MGAPSRPVGTFLVGIAGATVGLAVIATRVQHAVISPAADPADPFPRAYANLSFLAPPILAGTLWLGRAWIARGRIVALSAVVLLVAAVSAAAVALAVGIPP